MQNKGVTDSCASYNITILLRDPLIGVLLFWASTTVTVTLHHAHTTYHA